MYQNISVIFGPVHRLKFLTTILRTQFLSPPSSDRIEQEILLPWDPGFEASSADDPIGVEFLLHSVT
jgi:hypothetical protein